ncbi:MAG: hypothetical protein WBO17_10435 [Sphingorhabdus sp.]
MLHMFMAKGPWFRTRRYGYGAGLPFKWQGWATVGLYLLALAGIGLLSKQGSAFPRAMAFALFLGTTALFIAICRHRTEGGWKWRWGDRDRTR